MTQRKITDDLHALMGILPEEIVTKVNTFNNNDDLLEIILDIGRVPTARYVNEEIVVSDNEVTAEMLDYVVERVSDFDADNRAGIERTLHRISAIRNRRGHVIGLTCRVGRAVYGTTDILEDHIASGKSLLILGRPGVGKTTILREAARILGETKRVIVVDTSNEIGGDGDVPHPAVGRARRMQVAQPSLQHEVMIEAVENHNPEVIVIDEIGRELEATAARTIAERGVQLIGTAHGNTLDNLLLNPTLSDLVGGIESVTLSDEEARRRGTQKTVLERRSPPTFEVLIEIQTRDRLAIHADVSSAVDALLRDKPIPPITRWRDEDGNIKEEKLSYPQKARRDQQSMRRTPAAGIKVSQKPLRIPVPPTEWREEDFVRIFPYGVARNRLMQAADRLSLPVIMVQHVKEAQLVVTLRNHYRKRHRFIVDAEHKGVPIYVLRSNTLSQMERFLSGVFDVKDGQPRSRKDEKILAKTQQAIQMVLNGQRYVELDPATARVRRMQHILAQEADLVSHSSGKEPNRRVRIYQEKNIS